MSDTLFSHQRVVVTGGTRGIGAAISRAFLDLGAEVIATYHSNHEAALAFKDQCSFPERCEVTPCDIANPQAVESFFAQLDQRDQKLDVLINNGGIRRDSVAAMMKDDDWSSVINTNLSGAFAMSKHAIRNMMRQRHGRIINISSPMSRVGFAGQSNYAASKAGLEGMTRSICKEVASRGITVNCVSPGFIETELLSDLDEATVKAYKKLVPLRRFGRPEEVAKAVLFLAGPDAAYITGSVLEIAGGL